MTFGQIKTIVENQLIESYNNKTEFKQSLLEFREDILGNKNIAKLYSLYNELTTPQGLSESEAAEFLNEGISLIKDLLPKVRIPKVKISESRNEYKSIDELVYENNKTIAERLESKKEIINILTQPKARNKKTVNLPISSMIKIGNQTVRNFIENLDESSKKELESIINEDTKSLKIKFNSLKEDAAIKLNSLIEKETDQETKSKISETIVKIENEKFNQVSYFKLKKLVESL